MSPSSALRIIICMKRAGHEPKFVCYHDQVSSQLKCVTPLNITEHTFQTSGSRTVFSCGGHILKLS